MYFYSHVQIVSYKIQHDYSNTWVMQYTTDAHPGEQKYSKLLHARETGISSSDMVHLARCRLDLYLTSGDKQYM